MASPPAPRARPDVLLVGSFPPVGGRASAASLAALRRAWGSGDEVVTASLRPGAADLVARVAGPLAGLRLERARVAAGRPARLVLGLEGAQFGLPGPALAGQAGAGELGGSAPPAGPATPVGGRVEPAGPGPATPAGPGRATPAGAARLTLAALTLAGLTVALGRFEEVTVLLTGPLGLPRPLGRLLWSRVEVVVVERGEEGAATDSGVPAGKLRSVEPYEGPPARAGVSLLGPPEVEPRDLPVVLAGALGRRLLGRHFLFVRAQAIRVARRARRTLRAARG